MIAILIGAFLCIISFFGLRSHYKFFKTAIIVPGTVTGFKSHQHKMRREDGREITVYNAVASFEFDGQMREVVARSTSSVKPKIGKIVKIAVNPMDIEEAYICSWKDILMTCMLLITGMIFVWVGILDICGNFE